MNKSTSRFIPPYLYCPKCGQKIKLNQLNPDEMERIKANGYDDGGRGMCKCGVVLIVCHLPIPESPTYSIFFDVYQPTKEFLSLIEEKS